MKSYVHVRDYQGIYHARCGSPRPPSGFRTPSAIKAIEMPRNSPTGFVCAFFATFMGFALIWHIWWIVALAALGASATFVVFACRRTDAHDQTVIRSPREFGQGAFPVSSDGEIDRNYLHA